MKNGLYSCVMSTVFLSLFVSSLYGDVGSLKGSKEVVSEKLCKVAGNYRAEVFTTTKAFRDGAACSNNDECSSGVCEGGSCCTNYGDSCDSSSHCCGHQSCTNGTCPQ